MQKCKSLLDNDKNLSSVFGGKMLKILMGKIKDFRLQLLWNRYGKISIRIHMFDSTGFIRPKRPLWWFTWMTNKKIKIKKKYEVSSGVRF